MELELARLGVALAGTLAATYYDLTHNRTVPDWLTFGLVGIGIICAAITFNAASAPAVIIPVIFVFGIGYPLYRMGQIGGADVLLYGAIALLVPYAPQGLLEGAGPEPIVQLPFILSIFLASGVLFGIVTFARYAPAALKALMKGKVKLGREQALYSVAMLAAGVAVSYLGMQGGAPAMFIAMVVFSVVVSVFFYVFKEFIARSFLVENVTIAQIDEEDVLAVEEMKPALVKKFGLQKLLTRSEIEKLKKTGLKKFPVYKNLPAFTPYVLIALALSALFGDLAQRLLQL
ncbi:MAG: A24 family peptidase [Candidatus Micrarchaeia archaeon]|jgi:Flp pilus assembly protein protease CpaA